MRDRRKCQFTEREGEKGEGEKEKENEWEPVVELSSSYNADLLGRCLFGYHMAYFWVHSRAILLYLQEERGSEREREIDIRTGTQDG